MVLQYAKWALDKNQEVAVRVFTERVEGEKSEQLKPPFVIDFLKPYPDATLVYLEYLVNDKESKVLQHIQPYMQQADSIIIFLTSGRGISHTTSQ